MRLSNAWRKLKFAVGVAFCAAILLFCTWQLWSAIADGTVKPFMRGAPDWVTFPGSPGWFVFSVTGYLAVVSTFAALLAFALLDYWRGGRWRTRQDLDIAIRQTPEKR